MSAEFLLVWKYDVKFCAEGREPLLNDLSILAFPGPSPGDMDDVLFAALTGDDSTLQKYRVPLEGDPVFELDTVTVGGRFIQSKF